MTSDKKKKRGVQSIEVGWGLIEVLSSARTSLSLTDIAARSNMTPSRAYTYLVSFVRIGLVKQNETNGFYDLDHAALQLGLSAITRTDVIELSRLAMIDCRDQLGMTTFLSLYGNMGPAIVYWLQGAYPVTVQVQAGSVLPVIGSATGNVFLAYMENEALFPQIEQELLGEKVNHNNKALNQKIEAIRSKITKRGYAVTKGGLIAEVSGIAAPIFDHEKRIRAVMTTIGPKKSFDITSNSKAVSVMCKIVTEISTKMGADTSN